MRECICCSCVYVCVWSTSVTHPQAQQQLAGLEGGSEKEQASEPKPIHNNSSFAATANRQRAMKTTTTTPTTATATTTATMTMTMTTNRITEIRLFIHVR